MPFTAEQIAEMSAQLQLMYQELERKFLLSILDRNVLIDVLQEELSTLKSTTALLDSELKTKVDINHKLQKDLEAKDQQIELLSKQLTEVPKLTRESAKELLKPELLILERRRRDRISQLEQANAALEEQCRRQRDTQDFEELFNFKLDGDNFDIITTSPPYTAKRQRLD